MQVIYERCAAIDVHQKTAVTTTMITQPDGRVQQQTRTFATMTRDLLALDDWLRAQQITVIAMESTGVYWHPIFNILEEGRTIILVNAQHMKAVPGRKTDVKDSEWLADLLRHGLLKASFIPPKPIRDLRDLTRYRKTLVQERSQEVNRLQKLLEGANIKLAAVATDVLGKSGRDMLEALMGGEQDAEALAELARGKLRAKLPDLRKALEGRVQPHHRFLLQRLLAHIDFLEQSIGQVEGEIEQHLRPFEEAVQLVESITGLQATTSSGILAEIGLDMSRFPSDKHLASWAGVVRCITRLNIPGAARKNSKGGSWVNGLPHAERSWGTIACY
jgi:transposase